jgi:uncharacterized protein (DUF427 family)
VPVTDPQRTRHEDLVCSYEEPIVELAKIAGRSIFSDERAEIVVEPVTAG